MHLFSKLDGDGRLLPTYEMKAQAQVTTVYLVNMVTTRWYRATLVPPFTPLLVQSTYHST